MSEPPIALKDLMPDVPSSQHNRDLFARVPIQARRAACTHVHMTRLYGPFKCAHCGLIPSCRWVYRCTKDYGGQLPPWEDQGAPRTSVLEDNKDPGATNTGEGSRAELENVEAGEDVKLKPWMEKAISGGHYSPEQVEILKSQKRRVKDAIRDSELSFHLNQMVTRRSLLISDSVAANGQDSVADGPTGESDDPPVEPVMSLKMFPDCTYRACSTCRPLLRDRCWGCIDHAYEAPTQELRDLSKDNRPMSPKPIVQTLGFHTSWILNPQNGVEQRDTSPQEKEAHGQETGRAQNNTSPLVPIFQDNPEEPWPQSPRYSEPRLQRMRKSIRRAFRGNAGNVRLRKKNRETTPPGAENAELVEDIVPENTPDAQLSPKSMERIEADQENAEDEVHVPGGLALTEEAVDLGTADVITQV